MSAAADRYGFGCPRAPADEDERYAVENEGPNRCCDAESARGWVCSRDKGHDGDHIASDGDDILERWAPGPPAPDALTLADALARETEKALDRMDRSGGDGYGMPECPWCHRDGNIPDGPVDLADYHDADCELLASRAALAAYRTARGTR